MFVCRADKGSRRAIERRHQGTALRGCCAFLYGDPSTSTSATLRMTTRLSRHSISICRHRSTYGLHHQVILSEGLCPQSKDLRTTAYFIQTNSCKTAECVRLCGDPSTPPSASLRMTVVCSVRRRRFAKGVQAGVQRTPLLVCKNGIALSPTGMLRVPMRRSFDSAFGYAQNDNPFVSP